MADEFDEQVQPVKNISDKEYVGQWDGKKIRLAPGQIRHFHPNLAGHLVNTSFANGVPALQLGGQEHLKVKVEPAPATPIFVCQAKLADGTTCLSKFNSDQEFLDHSVSHQVTVAKLPESKPSKK